MNRLRTRLIAVFLLATLLPLGLTLWTSLSLLERSLQLAPLKRAGRVIPVARKNRARAVSAGSRVAAPRCRRGPHPTRGSCSPADAQAFRERGSTEEFVLAGVNGDRLDYYVLGKQDVVMYSRQLRVPLGELDQADRRGAANRGNFGTCGISAGDSAARCC